VLHPVWKPAEFPPLVPAIIECVNANRVPDAQLGHPELEFEAWSAFVKC
jgi:hypothetical protein